MLTLFKDNNTRYWHILVHGHSHKYSTSYNYARGFPTESVKWDRVNYFAQKEVNNH